MKSFIIQLPDGTAINQNTKLTTTKNGIKTPVKLSTEKEIALFIKRQWCKENNVKSFTQWANELNEDENYSGGFDKDSALDNLASTFVLNIDNKYVSLYEFFKTHLPFKQEVIN